MSEPRYWVLGESILREALDRAGNGEDPSVLLMELYANSESEYVEGEDR